MLVITTPTGQIGRQVLANILKDQTDQAVRVLVRDPERLPSSASSRVEVVQGSLTDPGALARAFARADSAFWLLPPDPKAPNVRTHLLDFTRPLSEAITDQNVKRLVYVTGLDRGPAANDDPVPAAEGMDELIAATAVSYRALRLPAFMDNLLTQLDPITRQGTFFYPIAPDRKLPTIATSDIAAVAARLLLDDTWSGQQNIPLLGPEDLSYNDMAQIMSDVLGRPIRYQQVPAEAFKANLLAHGMAEPWAQSLTDLLVAVDHGIYNTEPRTPASTTPTTFRQWCQDILKPAIPV
jgi:uncharacterized protein YbjT (DUF2867 family)